VRQDEGERKGPKIGGAVIGIDDEHRRHLQAVMRNLDGLAVS
jgi:hypothetical protein